MKTRIGTHIKTARETQGLTQEEVARRMKVSRQMVGRWESAESNPTLITLMRLAKALNCTLSINLS